MMPGLFCVGFGFTAQELVRQNPEWQVWGTSRSRQVFEGDLSHVKLIGFDGSQAPIELDSFADQITHILLSVPPNDQGDPVFAVLAEKLVQLKNLKWVGYLSTTGVYGDLQGGTATEDTACNPSGVRGRRRVNAERQWLDLYEKYQLPVHIFRLPGIYGPGRNQMVSLQKGKAHRIVKEGHVFSRIHVSDIAAILSASIGQPNPGRIYNVSDDLAAPPQDVVTYAAKLLGVDPPPYQDFETADLSPMARSFYSDNKKISNARIKSELGISLRFPTYKVGLKALSKGL